MFNVPQDNFDFITVQNFGAVQKVYKLDPYFPTSHSPKYIPIFILRLPIKTLKINSLWNFLLTAHFS